MEKQTNASSPAAPTAAEPGLQPELAQSVLEYGNEHWAFEAVAAWAVARSSPFKFTTVTEGVPDNDAIDVVVSTYVPSHR